MPAEFLEANQLRAEGAAYWADQEFEAAAQLYREALGILSRVVEPLEQVSAEYVLELEQASVLWGRIALSQIRLGRLGEVEEPLLQSLRYGGKALQLSAQQLSGFSTCRHGCDSDTGKCQHRGDSC
jgi:hypothetical protein